MQKVECFAQIAGLLAMQLQKGVVTNNFLRAADYDREAKTGLYVHETDGALLVLRDRGTHYVLTFFLQQGVRPSLPPLGRPVVTELPFRPKDRDAVLTAAGYFRALGFTEVLRRTRRTRPAAPASASALVRTAGEADFPAADAFLRAQFPERTGCIPEKPALLAALAGGQLLMTADETGLTGLLHYAPGFGASDIRHLAVREDRRGQGLAGALLGSYLAAAGGQKSQVWARTGNIPAERLYESHDYRPDGWQSIVLQYEGA